MTLPPPDGHLEVSQIAAYVDGAIVGEARREVERHLAECAPCRTEVADVSRVVRRSTYTRGLRIWIPTVAAAAAAAVIFAWGVPASMRQLADPAHRDPALTSTAAPRVLAPIGRVDSLSLVVWSAVPTADRYRVQLFDPEGTVLWQRETSDTTAIVPGTVSLRRGSPYYWKVESHTGHDRWTASELVEFVP